MSKAIEIEKAMLEPPVEPLKWGADCINTRDFFRD